VSGPVPSVDLLKLGGRKKLKLCQPSILWYVTTKEEMAKYSGKLFEIIQMGKVRIGIHDIYNLEDVAKDRGKT
jgi:hypothetical protein